MDYYDYMTIIFFLPCVVLVNLNWSVINSDYVTFIIYWILWVILSLITKQINTIILKINKILWPVAVLMVLLCPWIDHYRNDAQLTNTTIWKILTTVWSVSGLWSLSIDHYRLNFAHLINPTNIKIIKTLWTVFGLLVLLFSLIDHYRRNNAQQMNTAIFEINNIFLTVTGFLILYLWIDHYGRNYAQQINITTLEIKKILYSVPILILLCSWIGHDGRNDRNLRIYSGRDLFLFVSFVPLYKDMMNKIFHILIVFSSCIHSWFCQYGGKPTVLYISLLVVHVTAITVILVKVVTVTCMVVANVLSHGDHLYVNVSYKHLPRYEAIKLSTSIRDLEYSVYNVNNSHTKWINGDHLEYKYSVERRVVRRFPGEDVALLCEITSNRTDLLSKPRVVWFKDGKRLDLTYRHDLKTSFFYAENRFRVVSTLTIFLIQESDYGTYNCTIQPVIFRVSNPASYYAVLKRVLATKLGKCGHFCEKFDDGENRYYLHEVTIHGAIWRLEKSVPVTEYVTVHTGEVQQRHTTFVYTTFAEFEDIEVMYEIANIPYHEISIGLLERCSLSAFFHAYILLDPQKVSVLEITHDAHLSFFSVLYSTCVCPDILGVHNIKYYRHYHDASLNAKLLIEVVHPKTLFVYPDSTPRRKHTNYTNRFYKSVEEYNIWWLNTIIYLIIAFISIFFLYHTKHIWILYKKYLVIPLEHRIIHGNWTHIAHDIHAPVLVLGEIHEIQNGETLFENGVFISNCKEDEGFVENLLVPQLESWGLNVYFHKRDALLGGLKIKVISEAISKSRKIIAVLSKNYQNQRMINGFQMSCILNLYYDKKILGENILFLKYRPCEIPRVLIWDNDITVQDWTTKELSEKDKIRRIHMWLCDK